VKRITPLTDNELRRLGLDDDERLAAAMRKNERAAVYVIAFLYQQGHPEKAARLLGAVGGWPRMLRLVANELEGKRRKSDLTLTGERTVKAYWAARLLGNKGAPPIFAEVEAYWPKLFGTTRPPTKSSMRATLTLRKLPLREDSHRGPRGPWKYRRKTRRKN
jgi:hypothetical protein